MAEGISDDLIKLLGEADKRNGLPPGTMFSVMQQETGGNAKYVDDPTTYHYGLNKDGKRIAGHTGKISTAFGPFGILESTGKDPGYGVQPLKDKSLAEQVRFASDYLAARSKQAGGLEAGLAGYGEGGKYGKQVMARLSGGGKAAAPVAVAQAPVAKDGIQPMAQGQVVAEDLPPVSLASALPEQAAPSAQVASAPVGSDPWEEFTSRFREAAPVQAEDLKYAARQAPGIGVQVPDFMAAVAPAVRRVDMGSFMGWGARQV